MSRGPSADTAFLFPSPLPFLSPDTTTSSPCVALLVSLTLTPFIHHFHLGLIFEFFSPIPSNSPTTT